MPKLRFLGWRLDESSAENDFAIHQFKVERDITENCIETLTVPFCAPGFVILASGCWVTQVLLNGRFDLPVDQLMHKCIFHDCLSEGDHLQVVVRVDEAPEVSLASGSSTEDMITIPRREFVRLVRCEAELALRDTEEGKAHG